jgi:hypothetical protein
MLHGLTLRRRRRRRWWWWWRRLPIVIFLRCRQLVGDRVVDRGLIGTRI